MKPYLHILISILLLTVGCRSQAENCSPATIEEPAGITLRQFNRKIRDADKPLLIHFTADCCATCKKQKAVLQDIFAANNKRIELVIPTMENNPAIFDYFEVSDLPIVILYVDGYLVWLYMGFQEKEQIMEPLHLFIQ